MSPYALALGSKEKIGIELISRDWTTLRGLWESVSLFGILYSLGIGETNYAKSADWMISSQWYLT